MPPDQSLADALSLIAEHLSTPEREAVLALLPDGHAQAVDLLRSIDEADLRAALEALHAVDEDAVRLLQRHLFVFADIARLDDRELQLVLSRIDNPTVAQALSSTSDAVRERLLANVSERRAYLIEDDVELYAEAEEEEVEAARLRILSRRGEITTYFGAVDAVASPQTDEDDGYEEEEEAPAETTAEDGRIDASPSEPERTRRLPLVLGLVGGCALAAALVRGLSRLGSMGREDAHPDLDVVGDRPPSSSSATSSTGRVLVQRLTDAVSGKRAGDSGPENPRQTIPVASGQTLRVPEGVEAILQLPASGGEPDAEVTAGPDSEVEYVLPAESTDTESDPEDGEERAGRLDLRVGRVRIIVVKEGFGVRTPTALATGGQGAAFTVRVVLDGTTVVDVERGTVQVQSLRGRDHSLDLTAGRRARYDAQGGGEVESEARP